MAFYNQAYKTLLLILKAMAWQEQNLTDERQVSFAALTGEEPNY